MIGKAGTRVPATDHSFGAKALSLIAVIGNAVRVFRGGDAARHRLALRTFEPTIRSLESLIATKPQEFSAEERKALRVAIHRLRAGKV